MEREFWEKAWDERNIGFHMSETNAFLKWAIENQVIQKRKTALVPLCGKTLDLIFLRDLGFSVYGVELAEKAVLEFFNENDLEFSIKQSENFKIFETRGITIFCGDLFKLTSSNIPEVDFIYDRASNVALPPEMREDYYKKIKELSSANTEMLLLTGHSLDNDKHGPPFSIPKNEIEAAYKEFSQEFKILQEKKKKITSKRLKEQGISHRVMVAHYLKF
ncbi:thiopurine S-methyltransferase [Halobacteriovorax sp.]|uniref:thiopurine S-methyltransferase n=1 Tax=Halobacteriovorax sp. TaxID=2020862 RepID=UPI003569654E